MQEGVAQVPDEATFKQWVADAGWCYVTSIGIGGGFMSGGRRYVVVSDDAVGIMPPVTCKDLETGEMVPFGPDDEVFPLREPT